MAHQIEGILATFVAILVAVALVPTLAGFITDAQANVTGSSGALLGLVVVFFVIGILILAVSGMFRHGKGKY